MEVARNTTDLILTAQAYVTVAALCGVCVWCPIVAMHSIYGRLTTETQTTKETLKTVFGTSYYFVISALIADSLVRNIIL